MHVPLSSYQANCCGKKRRHVAIFWSLIKKGLQERELHLPSPEGSTKNPVTSSQSSRERVARRRRAQSWKQKKWAGVRKRESRREQYSIWGRVGEKEWECDERKAKLQEKKGGGEKKKRNAAESFRWKLPEWDDHDWTPPVRIRANPAADTRM